MSDKTDAAILLKIDDQIWRRMGLRSGGQLDDVHKWDEFKEMVANRTPYFVRKGVAELIESENHHSFLRALRELGRLD